MRLSTWLERGGTKAQIQHATGLRWATVHEIAEGRSMPGGLTALAICRATGGAVTVHELLEECAERLGVAR